MLMQNFSTHIWSRKSCWKRRHQSSQESSPHSNILCRAGRHLLEWGRTDIWRMCLRRALNSLRNTTTRWTTQMPLSLPCVGKHHSPVWWRLSCFSHPPGHSYELDKQTLGHRIHWECWSSYQGNGTSLSVSIVWTHILIHCCMTDGQIQKEIQYRSRICQCCHCL